MDRIFSRWCTCDICEMEDYAYKAYLPVGWLMTWEESATICDECLVSWVERWGEEPVYYMKGGEKELTLL